MICSSASSLTSVQTYNHHLMSKSPPARCIKDYMKGPFPSLGTHSEKKGTFARKFVSIGLFFKERLEATKTFLDDLLWISII